MLNRITYFVRKTCIRNVKLTKALAITVMTGSLIVGCAESRTNLSEVNIQNNSVEDKANQNQNISFLAFGDGGYHHDYPKIKHIKNPRNKAEFIAKERDDWLEDYRPLAEFDHAPFICLSEY